MFTFVKMVLLLHSVKNGVDPIQVALAKANDQYLQYLLKTNISEFRKDWLLR